MKTLIIITGASCSGKSTFIKNMCLQDRVIKKYSTREIRSNDDDIITDTEKSIKKKDICYTKGLTVVGINYSDIDKCLRKNRNIIILTDKDIIPGVLSLYKDSILIEVRTSFIKRVFRLIYNRKGDVWKRLFFQNIDRKYVDYIIRN